MQLPDVSDNAIQKAIRRFDSDFRDTPEYAGWQNRLTHHYALELDGHLYPVKKVLSLATGVPVQQFRGGAGSNSYLKRRGFKVVEIRANSIHDDLERILEHFPVSPRERFSKNAPTARLFRSCSRRLSRTKVRQRYPRVKVKAFYGRGGWAAVASISLEDRRVPDVGAEGILHPVLLFRPDGSGVYLTLGQKIATSAVSTPTDARIQRLRTLTGRIRAAEPAQSLAAAGFVLDDSIDLKVGGAAAEFEAATIAYKFYERRRVPDEPEILRDLEALLGAYALYVRKGRFHALPAPADPAPCLIGSLEMPPEWLAEAQRTIEQHGHWELSWRQPLRDLIRQSLAVPFDLYLNTDKDRFGAKCVVNDFGARKRGQARRGSGNSLRVVSVERLDTPLHLSDFRSVSAAALRMPDIGSLELAYRSERETSTATSLFEKALLDQQVLDEIMAAIRAGHRQIVLAGPPGTSKTFIAQAIAQHICHANPEAVQLVQFHPSYSYEAFVEGLRPIVQGGALSFERANGVLLDFIDHMRRRGHVGASAPAYFLLIDEMNRANLPRVFGELMYLFEYRDRPIRLQYSNAFSLPANLIFIGTMNTADRSIRSIDSALRRRFDVFELPPSASALERFFAKEETPLHVKDLINGFEALNRELENAIDRHHTIGHAFFMKPGLDNALLRSIWQRKIYPLIEDYFFDRLDIAREFTLERFWPGINP